MNDKVKAEPLNWRVEEPAVTGWYVHREENAHGQVSGVADVVDRIRRGLSFAEFEAVRRWLDLSGEELADHLGMSRSTLLRRKRTGRLSADESDRLVRHSRLFARVLEAVGDENAARVWLKTPARAFSYQSPLEYARTEAGAREAEDLLGRMEHGVFS